MDQQTEWITPAEAERLVAERLGQGALFSGEARETICGWIDDGRVRAVALEVVRWKDAPEPAPAKPVALPGGVQPLGSPVSRRDGKLERSIEHNYEFDYEDWRAVVQASNRGEADLSAFFPLAEVTHRLPGSLNPRARVVYSGIRFNREDVLRCLVVAGAIPESSLRPPAISLSSAERQCETWLTNQFEAGTTLGKSALKADALSEIHGLSGKGFLRAWDKVAPLFGRNKPGAPRKSDPRNQSAS